MGTWPAPLVRFPIQALMSESRPAGELTVTELAIAPGNPVNLPFIAQEQTQGNWCWSAVATSVGLFYGTGNWTQCEIATDQVNKVIHPEKVSDCCATPDSPDCNIYGYLYFSLQKVDSLDRWSPHKPTPSELHEYLARNKELVCLRISWNGGGAHFTTIRGCTDPASGQEFIVSTSDTLQGFSGSTLPYDDFPQKYHGGGTWTDTFLTTGRFAPAASCGNADSAAIDVNNNGNCVSLRCRNNTLFSSAGKIDRIAATISWGAEAALGPGSDCEIAIDDTGICVAIHAAGSQLFYRTGTLDVLANVVKWNAAVKYGTGDRGSVALSEHGVCLLAYAVQGKFYSSLGWLVGDGTIEWSNPEYYGDGIFNTVAMDDNGSCVELHSGSGAEAGKLLCRVGAVDLLNSKIKWGKSVQVGAGSFGSVSLAAQGRCIMTFIEGGLLQMRSGQVNTSAGIIECFPKVTFGNAEATAVAADDLGRFIETHVAQKNLFCAMGR